MAGTKRNQLDSDDDNTSEAAIDNILREFRVELAGMMRQRRTGSVVASVHVSQGGVARATVDIARALK